MIRLQIRSSAKSPHAKQPRGAGRQKSRFDAPVKGRALFLASAFTRLRRQHVNVNGCGDSEQMKKHHAKIQGLFRFHHVMAQLQLVGFAFSKKNLKKHSVCYFTIGLKLHEIDAFNSKTKTFFPMSFRVSKWASKQMNERCERTSERRSEWLCATRQFHSHSTHSGIVPRGIALLKEVFWEIWNRFLSVRVPKALILFWFFR